jgi:hypothetical protein
MNHSPKDQKNHGYTEGAEKKRIVDRIDKINRMIQAFMVPAIRIPSSILLILLILSENPLRVLRASVVKLFSL